MYHDQLPQLFLLHFAGGNSYSYQYLQKYLSPHYELIFLELPGRGKRMEEELITDRQEAVKDQLKQIQKHRKSGVDFVIYGHSMGAVLGFELTYLLEKYADAPSVLMVTGHHGPGPLKESIRYNLPKSQFIEALRTLGGLPDEIIECEELFEMFEPVLRADFQVVECHIEDIGIHIKTPIHCVMGSEEKFAHAISNWNHYTTGKFEYQLMKGNHFFIQEHQEELTELIMAVYHNTKELERL